MKTVVTDLDGTLLNKGKLSNKTIEVLKEFQKENRLILATGRNLESVKDIYEQLEMEKHGGALILVNGLCCYDFNDYSFITSKSFNKLSAWLIIVLSNLLLFRVTVVCKDKRIKINSLYDWVYRTLVYIIKGKIVEKEKQEKIVLEDIEKIEVYGTIFYKYCLRLLKYILFLFEVVEISPYRVEILPKGTNKVNRVKYFAEKYNINLEDLYVFGDGENDVEMLKYAIHSYAPANALDKAKIAAKHECLTSDYDGVALVVEGLCR